MLMELSSTFHSKKLVTSIHCVINCSRRVPVLLLLQFRFFLLVLCQLSALGGKLPAQNLVPPECGKFYLQCVESESI